MVAHLMEGFFDELRKLLEFPEFLENRAFMSQVRRASMLWALRCVHVHVVGFNEIYGDLKLCKPEVPIFWKCCSDWLGYNLWLLLWSEVQRYWRRFHFKAGPYRILNFDVFNFTHILNSQNVRSKIFFEMAKLKDWVPSRSKGFMEDFRLMFARCSLLREHQNGGIWAVGTPAGRRRAVGEQAF